MSVKQDAWCTQYHEGQGKDAKYQCQGPQADAVQDEAQATAALIKPGILQLFQSLFCNSEPLLLQHIVCAAMSHHLLNLRAQLIPGRLVKFMHHLLKGLKSEGEDDGIETAEASSPYERAT
mmetsp:Transcript_18856/g.31811  ORF Transcript_18856/g.31811 Transcript_18856/m.31811 type:complete len:121 (+) Transcript_18856:444-806(+)